MITIEMECPECKGACREVDTDAGDTPVQCEECLTYYCHPFPEPIKVVFTTGTGCSNESITLHNDPHKGCGTISDTVADEGDEQFRAAIDGMESLLMGMVSAGVDVAGTGMDEAIGQALEGLANHFS